MGRPRKKYVELRTFGGALAHAIRERAENYGRIQWPDDRFIREGGLGPVAFFEQILGVEVWSGGKLTGMREVLEAFQTNKMIVIKAGRRVSKSYVASGLSLLMFASYSDGKALLISKTDDQAEQTLYKTIREMWARSGTCLKCRKAGINTLCKHSAKLDGILGETGASGLKDPRPENQRCIFVRVGATPESYQGFGSPHMLIVHDEAASAKDENLQAIEAGQQASDGWFIVMGNPRIRGTGYEALFHPDSDYLKLTIPSTASPNYQAGEILIPGLANRAYVEKKIKQHGPKSAYVLCNIFGEFPNAAALQPFNRERLAHAVHRNATNQARGRLHIGLDPASYGSPDGRNDRSGLCARRGLVVLEMVAFEQHTPAELLDEVLRIIEEHVHQREIPVVTIDAEGDIGFKVMRVFRNHLIDKPNTFELWGIRGSEKAKRDPKIYDRQRDCLLGNLDRYLNDTGGIPDDNQLLDELAAFSWEVNHRGLSKAIDKKQIRKAIGRSPDLADALQLCCWQAPNTPFDSDPGTTKAKAPVPTGPPMPPQRSGSIYSMESKWRR